MRNDVGDHHVRRLGNQPVLKVQHAVGKAHQRRRRCLGLWRHVQDVVSNLLLVCHLTVVKQVNGRPVYLLPACGIALAVPDGGSSVDDAGPMGINQLTRHHVMPYGPGRVPVFVELPKSTWTALLIARAHAAQDLLDILLRQRWKAPLPVHRLDRGADMGIVLPLRLQARRIAKERVVPRTRADLLRQREAWARCAARARLSRRRCRAHEIQERQDVGIRLGDPDLLRRREPRVAPAVGVY